MNEDFVSFELAVKLKEKGFRERVQGYYRESKVLSVCITPMNSNALYNEYSAPTISQVLKWLRKEKSLHIEILHIFSEETLWDYEVAHIGSYERWWSNLELFDTYEQAAVAGIEYVLDKLI